MTATPRWFGERVGRIEDAPLLRGEARFTDDLHFHGMLHACFVRSPYAHARIRSIDRAAASALPGVARVLTLDDLAPVLAGDRVPVHMPSPGLRHRIDPFVLTRDEVCHVGEPVAVVLAASRHLAEDAVEQVLVDYEPLPVVADPRTALAVGAPLARSDVADNLAARIELGYGDCDGAFRSAPHVFREQIRIHKGGGQAIETRAVLAHPDRQQSLLTVHDSTQMPHRAHGILCAALGLAEGELRVVAPAVGGGFGPKFVTYPEEVAIAAAARLVDRPVKWIEDRLEHFTATTQERDQHWDVEAAFAADGRLLGIRGSLVHDHGAYTAYGTALPYNSGTNLLGPYVLPAYSLRIDLALTNKVPVTPTRGAGRPQGTFVMERLLDRVAGELGLDRAEVRRRNLIAPGQMPYVTEIRTRDGAAMTYDSGDYPACQQMVLDRVDWDGFAARRAAARADGRLLGIGLANYVEGSGRGPFESVHVAIGASGRIRVVTGASAQGQGIATVLAQLAAEQLGVAPADIQVVTGDTGAISSGLGAFASRQAVVAGNGVHQAARAVRDKALRAASHVLEAAVEDLTIRDARVHVDGAPDRGVALGELARLLAGMPGYTLPGGLPPGLDARVDFDPGALTYCNGTHACEVEVDPGTGGVRVTRYVVGHDCGRMINPDIVEGQILGGVVHGIGNALLEEMHHDGEAQPLTVHFGDYLLPGAMDAPEIEILHMESPTPLNPLGIKGAGESGTIPAAACIASAIDDALREHGIRVREIPVTPERLVEALEQAGAFARPGGGAA